jgi:hypothetical protein
MYKLFVIILFIIYEISQYIEYNDMKETMRNIKKKETNKETINKIMEDLDNYPDLFMKNVEDYFDGNNESNGKNISDMVSHLMGDGSHCGKYKEEMINKIHNMRKLQHYHNISNPVINSALNDIHNCKDNEEYGKNEDSYSKSMFLMTPILLIFSTYAISVELYMLSHSFTFEEFEGLKIWHNGYNPKKGKPLLFYHCSIGGVSVYKNMVKYLGKHYNIIMPEIICLSFHCRNNIKRPSMLEIMENVNEFIYGKKYKYIGKINLMGHSFGVLLCSRMINHHPEKIDNLFCVEGQLFYHGSFNIFKTFHDENYSFGSLGEILSLFFFDRNINVQYYMRNIISANDFIYDLENERSHIKVQVFHMKNDRRIPIDTQIEYSLVKKIIIKYHIFRDEKMFGGGHSANKNSHMHGEFITNSIMQKYVLSELRNIYK